MAQTGIRLNAFSLSAIPQKHFIIIIITTTIIIIIIIIYEEKVSLKEGKLSSTEYFTWFPKNISQASCRYSFRVLFTHAKNAVALILTSYIPVSYSFDKCDRELEKTT